MLDIICTVVTGIVSIASVIVPLTKTTKDDAILTKIVKFLDNFSVFNTKDDAELLKLVKNNEEILKIIDKIKK